MATLRTLPVPEADMQHHVDVLHAEAYSPEKKTSVNPLLVVVFVSLAVFPFIVRFLPLGFRQYLEVLFR